MPSFPRITQNLALSFLQASVARVQKDLLEAQRQVATQRRVSVPSDDPASAATIMRLRSDLAKLDSTAKTVRYAESVLRTQDGALANAGAILERAKELALQHASTLISASEREAAAQEVAELEKAFLATANSELAGRYLFGGLVSGGDPPFMEPNEPPLAPFDPPFDPVNTYVGPADEFVVRIGAAETMSIAGPGEAMFQAGITALDNLRVALEAGQETSANIGEVEQALEDVRSGRSAVGGKLRRLQDRELEISSVSATISEILSAEQDVDLAASLSALVNLEQVLSATLAAGSRLLNLDILDYVSL